jgi:hypothetical protein
MRKFKEVTDEELAEAVKANINIRAALKYLGVPDTSGSGYTAFKNRVSLLNICTKHFLGQGSNLGKNIPNSKIFDLKDILVENSTYTGTSKIRLRLLKEKIKIHMCEECFGQTWTGDDIPLELHHINGVGNDHRLENLQLLCPTCHSKTDHYRGRNTARFKEKKAKKELIVTSPRIRKVHLCVTCGVNKVSSKNVNCLNCNYLKSRKVERPSKEELENLIKTTPYTTIGTMFKVSDNAVRKWVKYYKI